MTTITKMVKQVTCNRCGHEDNWTVETPDYLKAEWSNLSQKWSGAYDFDLCPSCTREVKAWIRNGR